MNPYPDCPTVPPIVTTPLANAHTFRVGRVGLDGTQAPAADGFQGSVIANAYFAAHIDNCMSGLCGAERALRGFCCSGLLCLDFLGLTKRGVFLEDLFIRNVVGPYEDVFMQHFMPQKGEIL